MVLTTSSLPGLAVQDQETASVVAGARGCEVRS